MTHEDEQIMILAKLNGNWKLAGYRLALACENHCLEALINDKYAMICDIARRNLVHNSKKQARELGIIK